MASITGTATYRERIVLPPGTVLVATMADVARSDAAADPIATTAIPATAGPPFAFTLHYDPARLAARGRYVVRVTLRARDRLLFTSTESIPALDLDPDQPILLSRAGSAGG